MGVSGGSDRTLCYKLSPKAGDSSIIYAPPLESLRVIVMYHFRGDGRLPYYKDGIFKNSWIKDQYKKKVGETEGIEDLHIISVVSVIDASNNVDLHILSRSNLQLSEASWILQSAFGLFESPEQKLRSELCLLLQKISLSSTPKSIEKRLIEVERTLEEFNGGIMSALPVLEIL
jgi:hypothetical protein